MRLMILCTALRQTPGAVVLKCERDFQALIRHHTPVSDCKRFGVGAGCVFLFYLFFKKRDVKVLSVFYRPKINSLHLSNPPFITPVHSPSGQPRPSLSPHLDRPCYLPNIVRQRSGIFYWLKIKVAKSPPRSPPLLLAALKNRGKHQFLPHQWRLHNQLKKTLVWGCKSYLCLIRAFRRCMSGFNVSK